MLSVSSGLSTVQGLIVLALGLASLGVTVWALVDAIRQSSAAFPAAGKLTKTIWLAILGVAVALAIVLVQAPLHFLNLIAVVAAGVYLADVRPAVAPYRGRGGGRQNSGPYGPW